MPKKRRQTKTVEAQSLTDIIKRYGLLGDPKILKAVNLSYDIVQGCMVTVDKNQKRLTIEHIMPKEKERNLILSMKDSQVALTKENMPYAVVGKFLYQICLPIYYHVAKANNWRSSWVDRHIKPSRGDYWKKDTIIKVTAHPMSDKEKRDYIFKSIQEYYLAVKLYELDYNSKTVKETHDKWEKVKDHSIIATDNPEAEVIVEIQELWNKNKNKLIQRFIKDLIFFNVIDDKLKILCSESEFDKTIEAIAEKYADPKNEKTKICPKCNKVFMVTSKHQVSFCKDSCRSSAHTEAKRRIRKYLKSPGLEMKHILLRYSIKENGFIVQVKVPSEKAELSYVIDLSGKIREQKVE